MINAFLDDLALNLMGVYTRDRGINSSAQADWIYPGKIFQSDGGKNPFQALTRNSAQPTEALAVISTVKGWASVRHWGGRGRHRAESGESREICGRRVAWNLIRRRRATAECRTWPTRSPI